MHLELPPAVGEPSRIVEREATLPELRLELGAGRDERVEVAG